MKAKEMKAKEMFAGFDPKKQAAQEDYLINRYGGKARESIAESKQKVKNWTKADWGKSSQEWIAICTELAALQARRLTAEAPEVQSVVRRHHQWLKKFWTPTRESYIGMGLGYTEFAWKKTFEPYDPSHPRLAMFLAEGMKVYANRELA